MQLGVGPAADEAQHNRAWLSNKEEEDTFASVLNNYEE